MKSKIPALIFFSLFANFAILPQDIFYSDFMDLPPGLDEIYVRGLNYLKRTQDADGTWKSSHYGREPGTVGICVAAMLARGDDPVNGPYSENIKRGLDYILKSAKIENGYIGNSMYNHGFATLALAEAYGQVDDARIGTTLQKAVELIVSAQKRNGMGAWRYTPDSTDADTTVSGACLVALFAAANAGIKVPDESIKKALDFFRSSQCSDGGIGYTGPDNSNMIRTGIGALAFALAKQKKTAPYLKTMDYLSGRAAEENNNNYLFYGLYYSSQAFFHSNNANWNKWNLSNIKFLTEAQNQDGSWQSELGAEFSTGAALLSLALNYRYLPIYER
jgi:squalene cyclase